MFSKDPAGSVPCQREGHRPFCGRRPTNDKAAKRRPVINPGICHEENLERAKGLEPSTPTLARSCSTTELHPHPRWRRTRAVNGRPMPNADRECNSPRAIRCHADDPISVTIGANRFETTPKRGLSALLPTSGTQDQAAGAMRGDSSRFSNQQPPTSPVDYPTRHNRNRSPLRRFPGCIGVPRSSGPTRSPAPG